MGFEDVTRPSPAAADRLARSVGSEVASLRTSLNDAMAEAARLEAEGRTDLAVEVLEGQRDVLARVHQQLELHLSAAAVEREAEAVVAAVLPEPLAAHEAQLVGLTSTGPTGAPPVAVGAAGRLLASAVAAVIGIVLLGVGSAQRPGGVAIAGVSVDDAPDGGAVAAGSPRAGDSRAVDARDAAVPAPAEGWAAAAATAAGPTAADGVVTTPRAAAPEEDDDALGDLGETGLDLDPATLVHPEQPDVEDEEPAAPVDGGVDEDDPDATEGEVTVVGPGDEAPQDEAPAEGTPQGDGAGEDAGDGAPAEGGGASGGGTVVDEPAAQPGAIGEELVDDGGDDLGRDPSVR